MKRLRIGIVGWSTGDKSFGVGKPYLEHLKAYGDPIILPPMEDTLDGLDLIVLPGGRDTISYLYGQAPGFYTGEPDPFKEYFVHNNLDKYIKQGVAVWGTCLGFQQLVVKYGGTLVQDIDLTAHGHSGDQRATLVHPLVFSEKYKELEKKLLKVTHLKFKKDEVKCLWSNSLHHQAVPMAGFPECLDAVACSPDGYVEAIKHKDLLVYGCQFHLEEDGNDLGTYLFQELIYRIHDKINKGVKRNFVEVAGT